MTTHASTPIENQTAKSVNPATPAPCHQWPVSPSEPLSLADLPARPIQWLWQNRLPLAHLTLLTGLPASGKTSLTLHLAAQLSLGLPLDPQAQNPNLNPHPLPNPNPNPNPNLNPALNPFPTPTTDHSSQTTLRATLLLSPEESSSSLLPRLQALGADLRHIHILPEFHSLAGEHAFENLNAALDKIPNLALILIDPITHFLGADYNAHPGLLLRLAHLARDRNLALLLTATLPQTKLPDPAAALQNPSLLTPILNRLRNASLPRTIHLLLPTPAPTPNPNPNPNPAPTPPPDSRSQPTPTITTHSPDDSITPSLTPSILFTLKSNLTSPQPPLAFTLTPSLHWTALPEPPQLSIIHHQLQPAVPWAIEYLQTTLQKGAIPATDLLDESKELGIPDRALAHAKLCLGITSYKQTFSGTWYWRLPGDQNPLPTDPVEKRRRQEKIEDAKFQTLMRQFEASREKDRQARKARQAARAAAAQNAPPNPPPSEPVENRKLEIDTPYPPPPSAFSPSIFDKIPESVAISNPL